MEHFYIIHFLILLAFGHVLSTPVVDIIITERADVFHLRKCIDALQRHEPNRHTLRQRIIFGAHCKVTRRGARAKLPVSLCRINPSAFLCSTAGSSDTDVLHGIASAFLLPSKLGMATSDSVVLLSPYCIVTMNWLTTLHSGLFATKNGKIGMVGPVSNYAKLQSIPNVLNTSRLDKSSLDVPMAREDWSKNEIPRGMDLAHFARELDIFVANITTKSRKAASNVPLTRLDANVYMFKRELLDNDTMFKAFTAETYPSESELRTDFTALAIQAGYQALVIPSVYVYVNTSAIDVDSSSTVIATIPQKQKQLQQFKHVFRKGESWMQ
mmetsp:Transcript_8623/g.14331  ORF Transcript_8623/g.14331 Transcript_8623/m.14331 type:complete len:326 (-) Transcript_8623:1814-2791(-)